MDSRRSSVESLKPSLQDQVDLVRGQHVRRVVFVESHGEEVVVRLERPRIRDQPDQHLDLE